MMLYQDIPPKKINLNILVTGFEINKSLVFISILFIKSLFLSAQQDYEQPQVTLPSPKQAELLRFSEVPVGHFTGTPNISVPIYTAVSGDLQVPISASYNASGIKVDQEAGWIGLGWVLNTGGSISRVIRGKDDFGRNNFGYPTSPVHPRESTFRYRIPNIPVELAVGPFSVEAPRKFHKYIEDGVIGDGDLEADEFFYNFPGGSGKFLLPRTDGNLTDNVYRPHLVEGDNIDIKLYLVDNDTKTFRFVITDAYGTKYYFGTTEESTGASATRNNATTYRFDDVDTIDDWLLLAGDQIIDEESPLNITTWHLDSIQSIKDDRIEFIYDKIGFTASTTMVEQKLFRANIEQETGLTANTFSGSVNEIVDLKEIIFENGKVEFFTGERYDMRSFTNWSQSVRDDGDPTRLTGLRVSSLSDNETIQETVFHQSYYNEDKLYDYRYSRLKLDSLTINEGLPAYKFTYLNNTLPSKESFSKDHWGYYNGANNKTLLPAKGFYDVQDYNIRYGADRSVSPNNSKRGILTKVHYPTGGSTSFQYSHPISTNERWVATGSFRKETILPAGPGNNRAAFAVYLDDTDFNLPNGITTSQRNFLNLAYDFVVDATFSNTQDCDEIFNGLEGIEVFSGIINNDEAFVLDLDNADTNTIIDITNQSDLESVEYAFEEAVGVVTEHYIPLDYTEACLSPFSGHDRNLELEPGWYIFYIGKSSFQNLRVVSSFTFPNEFSLVQSTTPARTPGVRLQQMTTEDKNGGIQVKQYQYSRPIVPTLPEYSIPWAWAYMTIPNFEAISTNRQAWEAYSTVSSESIEPLLTALGGGFTAYQTVSEYHGVDGTNGKTEYRFHPPGASPLNDDSSMFLWKGLPYRKSARGGKIQKVMHFNATNDLLKETSYKYADFPLNQIPFTMYRSVAMPGLDLYFTDPESLSQNSHYAVYNFKRPYLNMLKTEEISIDYFGNSEHPLQTKTEYSYQDYATQENGQQRLINNLLPVKIETTNSDGSKKIVLNRFPASFSDNINESFGTILQDMKSSDKNIIAPVIEQQIWNQNSNEQAKLVGGKFVTYGLDFLPNKIETIGVNQELEGIPDTSLQSQLYQNGANYEERVNIVHNTDGNISTMKTYEGVSTKYVYGYSNDFPIIKAIYIDSNLEALAESTDILPSGYNTLESLLLSVNDIASNAGQKARWKEYNENLRTALPFAMVTTYTYNPLIGVTSITDPRGYTIYYEYDDFNRLKAVKDAQGNLVEDYKYHYRGEQ